MGIKRRIIGYLTDVEEQWIAVLECGHTQQVRHDPPWTMREWVTTEEGRMAHVGTTLDCKQCE